MVHATAVVGLGRSGASAARLLSAQGHTVWLLERRRTPQLHSTAMALRQEGLHVQLDCALTFLEQLNPRAVVLSPGVGWAEPVLVQLRRRGVPVHGETELAWQTMTSAPWIGVTGTNGKTTITAMVSHLLQQAGRDAPICGNSGATATELALERHRGRRPDWVVAELSSFQIEASPTIAPHIGIWSTLTPDHLDRHGSFAAYGAIKAGLATRSAIPVLNGDDPEIWRRRNRWPAARWITCRSGAALQPHRQAALSIEEGVVTGPTGPLFSANVLSLPGQHNRVNMLLATAAALETGLEPGRIAAGLRSFPGVPHRLETIARRQGVTYINDSKATNYDAARTALAALDGPLVLLAGGRAKQGDAHGWLQAIAAKAAAVICYGEAGDGFAAQVQQTCPQVVCQRLPDLGEAVPRSHALALEQGVPTVLLSPACASFDQYPDFEARGEHFRALVQALGEATPRANPEPPGEILEELQKPCP
ncbi:UDP-N-acetylmuramoyl-L-alanine--D-glutamate ligase [Candidatus Synechococcus spongiarum]|uniref:UDP-N-acetylmuramoyl-L-alanine--D-glutamate ligase n=1 Tax=Candidatus Synechococcus spongiarum TaxID=431041 RepID=UPI0004712447|nr:UDP-N-acetylmuramoyl-L-alanine--D-glutamate ligase [Candidatus Synechococcus spongiarum]